MNPQKDAEVFPCGFCGRKFVQKSLEVHLRSCNKGSKSNHGQGYNNQAFLANLDQQMEKENTQSSYKSSKKAPVDPNKAFLDKLDKEMAQEKEKSGYAPSQPKKKEVADPNKGFLDKLDKEMANEKKNPLRPAAQAKKASNPNQDFLDKLDKEMAQEKEKSGYAPSQIKKKEPVNLEKDFEDKINKALKQEEENPKNQPSRKQDKKPTKDNKQDFMNKLDKAMEKDSQKPYVPYKSNKNVEDDPEKAFIDRLDQEMQKEDTYKSSQKKKPTFNEKEDFMAKLDQEMKKEDQSSAGIKTSLLCYLCNKTFPIPQLSSHIKTCEVNWRMKNLNKDPNLLKPKTYASIMQAVAEKKEITPEMIEEYNQQVFEKQKSPTYTVCDSCARNIPTEQLEEHMEKCMPNAPSMKSDKKEAQPVDSNKLFQEKLEKELNEDQGKAETGKKSSASKVEMKKDNKVDLDKLMKEQGSNPSDFTLVPCEQCGRKFASDRLQVHLKSCKGKK